MSSPDLQRKTQVYELRRAFVPALSPVTRWDITNWCSPARELPFGESLDALGAALHTALGERPPGFGEAAEALCGRWDEAAAKEGGCLKLLILSLCDAYTKHATSVLPVKTLDLLAHMTCRELEARASVMGTEEGRKAGFPFQDILRRIPSRAQELQGEELAGCAEGVVRAVLGDVISDADLVEQVSDSHAERLRKAILAVDFGQVEEERYGAELERLDPVMEDVERLVLGAWTWTTERVGEELEAILGLGLCLQCLQYSPMSLPAFPDMHFRRLAEKGHERYPEPFRRYAHAYWLAEYYWTCANAAGLVDRFPPVEGVCWAFLASKHDFLSMVGKVTCWSEGQLVEIPKDLRLRHLPVASAGEAGRERGATVHPSEALTIILDDRRDEMCVNGTKWTDVTKRMFKIFWLLSDMPGHPCAARVLEGEGISNVREVIPKIRDVFKAHGLARHDHVLSMGKASRDGHEQWVLCWQAAVTQPESLEYPVRRCRATPRVVAT